MMGYYAYGWGMPIVGWTLMAVFWVAVIWLVIWLIRKNESNNNHTQHNPENRDIGQNKPQDDKPQEELKLRYVRGELTHEQYARMKKELQR